MERKILWNVKQIIFDSAESMTPLSSTPRCQWHHRILSYVNISAKMNNRSRIVKKRESKILWRCFFNVMFTSFNYHTVIWFTTIYFYFLSSLCIFYCQIKFYWFLKNIHFSFLEFSRIFNYELCPRFSGILPNFHRSRGLQYMLSTHVSCLVFSIIYVEHGYQFEPLVLYLYVVGVGVWGVSTLFILCHGGVNQSGQPHFRVFIQNNFRKCCTAF